MAKSPNFIGIWDIDQTVRDSTEDWPAINRFANAIYHIIGHRFGEFPEQSILSLESATDFTVAKDLANFALQQGWGESYYHSINFE